MEKYFPLSISQGTWGNKSITFLDYSRIIYLIQDSVGDANVSPDVLHYLYLMVLKSKKYFSNEVPDNIITMNSEVILQFDDKQKQKIRIVYPKDIKSSCDKSIYSPIGAACLGASEKSFIYYVDKSGYIRSFIERLIFQPEKEKLFSL